MTEDEWVDFAYRGWPYFASVGRLPPDLCKQIRASTNLVRIRHDYVRKLVLKHRYEPHRLPMMEQCLLFGRVIKEGQWYLTFFYFDEIVFGCWHQLTIKAADRGNEVWVCTFHRQEPAEVKRLTKRGVLIRTEIA